MSGEIRKRSVLIAGHATSVSLEVEFWDALKAIADRRGSSLNALVAAIDGERSGNLSSALRVFVLKDVQEQVDNHSESQEGRHPREGGDPDRGSPAPSTPSASPTA